MFLKNEEAIVRKICLIRGWFEHGMVAQGLDFDFRVKEFVCFYFISSLIYLFVPGFLFEIEGIDDFCYKTRPYSIISLIFSYGFLVYDFLFRLVVGASFSERFLKK